MRSLIVLSIAGVALVAGALVERAKADQAFLCEGGRIAYARGLADLERLKTADPCVAGYFGKSTLRGADRPEPPPAATLRTGTATASGPVASARAPAEPYASSAPVAVRILNGQPGNGTWSPKSP